MSKYRTLSITAWPSVAATIQAERLRPTPPASRSKGFCKWFRRKAHRQHPYCQWCGCRLEFGLATVDHVVPLALGGTSRSTNLVLSCEPCNVAKGGELPKRRPRGPRWVVVERRLHASG